MKKYIRIVVEFERVDIHEHTFYNIYIKQTFIRIK